MPGNAVFIFDSSFPSVAVALPIDDRRPHVVVSNRRIEPPPGHSCLHLEKETSLGSVWRNLGSLRTAWVGAAGGGCVVIAASGVRPEQLLINAIYALFLSRETSF